MDAEHRHLVFGRVNEVLALAWCECGAEYMTERDRWRDPPKTLEGKQRRQEWARKQETV